MTLQKFRNSYEYNKRLENVFAVLNILLININKNNTGNL